MATNQVRSVESIHDIRDPAVVALSVPWLASRVDPLLSQLQGEYKNVTFAQADARTAKGFKEAGWDGKKLPVFFLCKDGSKVDIVEGLKETLLKSTINHAFK